MTYGQAQPVIDVFCQLGQSDARGVNNGVEPDEEMVFPNPNCEIIGYEYEPDGSLDTVIPRLFPLDYSKGRSLGKLWGVELPLAYYHQKKFAIIKVSQGSSSLKTDWLDDDKLRDNFKECRAKVEAKYNGYLIRWHFHWDQWQESCTNTTESNEYGADFLTLFNDLWDGYDLSTITITRVHSGASSSYYSANTTNCNTIIASQEANALLLGAELMNVNDLVLWDLVHRSAESNVIYASRLNSVINWS